MSARLKLLMEAAIDAKAVDRENRIIRNAALLGDSSPSHSRTYTAQALADAARLISEGAQIYIDHLPAWHGHEAPRTIRDLVGEITGAARVDGNRVRADVRIFPGDDGDKVLDLAEAGARKVGFSIDALGVEETRDDGSLEVTKIIHVFSVDVVSQAGTVSSFFESAKPGPAAKEAKFMDPKDIAKLVEGDLRAHNGALVTQIEEGARRELAAEVERLKTEKETAEKALREANAQLSSEKGARLVESTLSSDEFSHLPDAAKAKIREAVGRLEGDQVSEAGVLTAARGVVSFAESMGATFPKPTGDGKPPTKIVEGATGSVPESGDTNADDQTKLRESVNATIFDMVGAKVETTEKAAS